MPALNRKTLFPLLFIILLTVVVTLVPEILGQDLGVWCETYLKPYLGEHYKIWLLGAVLAACMLLAFLTTEQGRAFFNRSKATADRPLALTPEESQKNYETIRKYLIEKRYQPRLEQKLAGDQLFNLRVKQSSEGTSKEKSDTFRTLQGKKSGEEIRQIFEAASRRLLITGLPGAGKTSLLLHLALKLLQSEKETLAVLLNLATWSSKYATFDDWLREILPTELGVTKRYAADILQAGKLTLLLDGLDEVAGEHRASCLKAIGEHGRQGRDYVISTRKNEYNAIEKDAPVWAQIEVLPLTKMQLLAQLDKADRREFPEAPDLKAALEHDSLLLKVAETPFYLNTLQLLFRGGSTLSELKFSGGTVEGRQAEIVERFAEQALPMRSPHGYSAEQVRRWLAFFASRLAERNKVGFELVDLQYDWWKWGKVQSKVIWLTSLLVSKLIMGLIAAFMGWEIGRMIGIISPIIWLFTSFSIALIFYKKNATDKIISKDTVQWSWKAILRSLKENTRLIFFTVVLFGIVGGISESGLIIRKEVGVLLGEPNKVLFERWVYFSPNKPWFDVLMVGLVVGMLSLPFVILLILIGDILLNKYTTILQITRPYQRFTASAKSLHFSILQHWLLRWQLYRAGVLPLRLVDFLNEMSTRHLLETDGATWRFRHRILQEYFAGQWKEEK